ncbi:MAG: PAS domain S-box protein [Phyllobacterium sp.]
MIVSGTYPFIDVAALDGIRERFIRGDALVVVSADLAKVIWTNGPGARLFGFSSIDGMIGSAGLPVPTRRQLLALDGFPSLGTGRILMTRIASGVQSRLLQFAASEIEMPDGVYAVLLAHPLEHAGATIEINDTAVTGLDGETTHAAILDASASILTASEGFVRLGFEHDELLRLIDEVRLEQDRMVKRPVRTLSGLVPTGMARLTDDPAIHLLVAVSDTGASVATEQVASPAVPLPQDDAPQADQNRFTFDPSSDPARFVWRVDADTHFTEISPEFASAVGPHSADIIGRRFADVARVFAMDTDGEISALLEGRATWSGRCILWPVEGTDLHVPVELAALPVYSRERNFMGFRGFGIVRRAEARNDPEAVGLALLRSPQPEAETATSPDADAAAVADETATQAPDIAAEQDDTDLFTAAHEPSPDEAGVPDAKDQGKPARRDEEKPPRQEGRLSPVERNAFREIAERLRTSGIAVRQEEDHGQPPETDATENQPSAGPDEIASPSSAVRAAAENLGDPDAADEQTIVHFPVAARNHDYIPSAFAAQPGGAAEKAEIAHLAQLPLPLLVHRHEKILYANRAFLDFTGFDSLAALEEAGGLDSLMAERDDNADPASVRLNHRDGTIVQAKAHLQAVPWDEERALMLAFSPEQEAGVPPQAETPDSASAGTNTPASAVQPTDREIGELKIRIDELTSILDTATDGIILLAQDGTIRSFNNSAAALFGYEPDEVKGKPFTMLFAIESHRAAMDYLNGLAENGVASLLNDGREVIGREAQGRFLPLFMTIGNLPNSSGYCAVIRDITTWKRAEEELVSARREAERTSNQKTEFLARISHEVRTPLNAIIGFSELMSDEKFGPIGNDRYKDYLRDINRSGRHVLDLINDLLDISKIEAGAFEMDFEAVSLNDILAETVAIMQPQANRERVIIRSSFNSNLPDIVADTRSIKQIGLNLLSNAVRFTGPGGQVIISTNYEASGDVTLRVRDTGVGMSPQDIEIALKPYKQVANMRRGRGDGTGLGLPLTKAMAEANRASFKIDSTPGRGTIVEIAFPSTRVLAD